VELDGLLKKSLIHTGIIAEAIGIYLSETLETSGDSQVGRATRIGKLLGELLANGVDLKPVLEHFFDRITVRTVVVPGAPSVAPKVALLQGVAFGSRVAPRVRFELLHLADQSRDRFVSKEAQNLLKS
jgi:hypothetical protein